jgi:three-Cys-motif partner protein
MSLRIDEIGPWSEVKLDILRRYATEYSKILTNQQRPRLTHVYVDAFAGAGVHISRTTGEMVPGSPLNALIIDPPFREYHLIDLDGDRVAGLRRIVGDRPDVYLYEGDCNKILLESVFPRLRYEDYRRGLCILDPYALHLDWTVVQRAGEMRSIELFINFPIYDININVLHHDVASVDPTQSARLTRFWGNESWKECAYERTPTLFGEEDVEKVSNREFAIAFQSRLKQVAHFRHVPDPLPMRNSNGSIVYYLYFASNNDAANDIVSYIFGKFGRHTI